MRSCRISSDAMTAPTDFSIRSVLLTPRIWALSQSFSVHFCLSVDRLAFSVLSRHDGRLALSLNTRLNQTAGFCIRSFASMAAIIAVISGFLFSAVVASRISSGAMPRYFSSVALALRTSSSCLSLSLAWVMSFTAASERAVSRSLCRCVRSSLRSLWARYSLPAR